MAVCLSVLSLHWTGDPMDEWTTVRSALTLTGQLSETDTCRKIWEIQLNINSQYNSVLVQQFVYGIHCLY